MIVITKIEESCPSDSPTADSQTFQLYGRYQTQTHTTALRARKPSEAPVHCKRRRPLCETTSLKVAGEVVGVAVYSSRADRPAQAPPSDRGAAQPGTGPTYRIVPRGHGRQPTASQRVRDKQSGCWSLSLREHVGRDVHNRAPRAETRRRRPPPQNVSWGQPLRLYPISGSTKRADESKSRWPSRYFDRALKICCPHWGSARRQKWPVPMQGEGMSQYSYWH